MFALGGIQSTAFNQVPTVLTSVDQLLYISASMAFSLLFTVWLFARSVTLDWGGAHKISELIFRAG